MKRFITNGLIGTLALVGTLGAQTVNQRRENQQDRIAAGVASGRLTAGETARLENREARINRQIRDDREDHHGRLTAGERAQLNREQNRMSREIEREKHNSFHQ